MRIIGYGICGPGEADKYLRQTLEEFKRLCDEVVILCNNTGPAEHDLIDSFGFKRVPERREWGRFQWKIKQDFLERDISKIAKVGDMMVCLDMDEVLDRHCTREWLMSAELDAYHVFVVDLWNDGYKPESCFWNVRLWRWNGETKFKAKPVHCGLAPEWAYHYHRYAPFILKHYGLKDKDVRLKKIERYKKYDPNAVHLDRKYYDMLLDDRCKPFDEEAIHDQIAREVASYKQTKPRDKTMAEKKKERYAYVKNPHGEVVDIPEKHLKETLNRKGFEFIGYADEQQNEIEEMFEDTDLGADEGSDNVISATGGSYQRPSVQFDHEVASMNAGTGEEPDLLDEEDIDLLGKDEPDLEPADDSPENGESEPIDEDQLTDEQEDLSVGRPVGKAKVEKKKPAAKKPSKKGKK